MLLKTRLQGHRSNRLCVYVVPAPPPTPPRRAACLFRLLLQPLHVLPQIHHLHNGGDRGEACACRWMLPTLCSA